MERGSDPKICDPTDQNMDHEYGSCSKKSGYESESGKFKWFRIWIKNNSIQIRSIHKVMND